MNKMFIINSAEFAKQTLQFQSYATIQAPSFIKIALKTVNA